MAFNRSNLARIGGSGNSPVMWQYTTSEALTAPVAADYFLPAISEFTIGDTIIFISTATPTAPTAKLSYVKTLTASSITLAGGLTITA
tara:strand:- start:903 stop:1166 length:264 start_codon:yes stop_codon:yes gene_type:complete